MFGLDPLTLGFLVVWVIAGLGLVIALVKLR
jgi:hypothetical protein